MNRTCLVVLLALALISTSCTTLKTTEAPPEEVHRLIVTEDILKPGDEVKIVTTDGVVHEFRVTRIDRERGLVFGDTDEIPIVDIVALETREISIGRTALLAGGVAYVVLAVLTLILLSATY
jgi:hypothetical protein